MQSYKSKVSGEWESTTPKYFITSNRGISNDMAKESNMSEWEILRLTWFMNSRSGCNFSWKYDVLCRAKFKQQVEVHAL